MVLLAGALLGAAPSAVTGRWIVTVTGPVQTTCLATISDAGGVLAGEVACREAGVELKISGGAQGDLSSGTAAGGVSWTAARDGAGLVGTWQSPQGSGTWTARRAPQR
jgi:hypothetical protein